MYDRSLARIAVLQESRDEHMLQVNLFNVAIGELEALLRPSAATPDETVTADQDHPAETPEKR